jgi:p-hydroxybenzoate 3-monooxygenase
MGPTQVGIVGAGPAGLTLALLLHSRDVDAVVLEARSREYVEQRVRAGVLEPNTVELFQSMAVAERLVREGLVHDGIYLRRQGQTIHIRLAELTGRHLTVYGQQEVVKDLVGACSERGIPVHFDLAAEDVDPGRGQIGSRRGALECDFIAGCDGFHGICREAIPAGVLTEHEYGYPMAWLGILADATPTTDELIYAWHENGFALYSMRSPTVSRLYLQVPADEDIGNWPDERIWEELQVRLGTEGWHVGEGEIFEKGITPMRSFVCEPMQHRRLFLAGDAAHIVPPTGAKGLNLAVNDARILAAALVEHYENGDDSGLEAYSTNALRRVWRAQDFSNYMTRLLHDLGEGGFEAKLQLARLEYLERSEAAQCQLAENYVGLPARDDF